MFSFFLFRSSNFLGHFVGTSIQVIARLILFFFPSFYLIILLSPEFMVVLHDLIHSSRVHQDFVGGVQASFLLASRSAINSPYFFWSGVLHFFILLSYSDMGCGRLSPYDLDMLPISPQQAYSFRCWFSQQLRSILPSKFFSNFFNSFQRFCVMSSSSTIPSSRVHVLILPFF